MGKNKGMEVPENRQSTVQAEPIKKSTKTSGTRAAAAMKLLQSAGEKK